MRFIEPHQSVPESQVYPAARSDHVESRRPTLTPMAGAYTLADADLNTINGLAGRPRPRGHSTACSPTFTPPQVERHARVLARPRRKARAAVDDVRGDRGRTNGTTKPRSRGGASQEHDDSHHGMLTSLPRPGRRGSRRGNQRRPARDVMRLASDTPNRSSQARSRSPRCSAAARRRTRSGTRRERGTVRLKGAHLLDPT